MDHRLLFARDLVTPRVQVMHRGQHLRHAAQRLGFAQRAVTADDALQVIARHIIHHQVLAARRLDKIVRHLGQVGMLQPRQDVRLALELLLRIGAGVAVLLDRHHVLRQVRVAALEDCPHAAPAQATAHAVAAIEQPVVRQRAIRWIGFHAHLVRSWRHPLGSGRQMCRT